MEKRIYLAIDVGGSKLLTGLVQEDGTILSSHRVKWRSLDEDQVLAQIFSEAGSMLDSCPGKISSIGLTVPGTAAPSSGLWRSAAFMGIYNLPIRERISSRFGLSTYIENDTNACCLAEKMFGSGKNCRDFMYLTVSNGVGGALFLNNRLYYGADCCAGEFGMCVVEEGGIPLEGKRPLRGSLEMYAAGRGLVRNYLEEGGQPEIHGKKAEGPEIARLARAKDPAALRAFEREGYYLGKVIAAGCNILDPEKVIIGGGISLAFDLYRDALDRTISQQQHRLESYREKIVIEPSLLGGYGGLYGAASAAILGQRQSDEEKYGYRG